MCCEIYMIEYGMLDFFFIDYVFVFLIEDDDVVCLGCEQVFLLVDVLVQFFVDVESVLVVFVM